MALELFVYDLGNVAVVGGAELALQGPDKADLINRVLRHLPLFLSLLVELEEVSIESLYQTHIVGLELGGAHVEFVFQNGLYLSLATHV